MDTQLLKEIHFLLATFVILQVLVIAFRFLFRVLQFRSSLRSMQHNALLFKLNDLFLRKDYSELLQRAEEHLKRYPNDKEVIAIMAKLAYARNERHQCRDYLNLYLTIHPQFDDNLQLYANALEPREQERAINI